jgi:hypothetical protein
MSLLGTLIALGRRGQGLVWRLLGIASRVDVAAIQAKLETSVRQMGRATAEIQKTGQARKGLDHRLSAVAAQLEQMQTQLGSHTRGIEGALRHVDRNVNSLVRHDYVDQASLPFPHNVLSQRFHLWSQNEEDGITLALLKLVGTTNRRFVELGAGVNGGNSGFLAEVCGWTGLMVDGSPARAAKLAARFGRFGVHTQAAWITTEGVNQLIADHGLTGEVDLLSLDIDGNDYWVWEQLDICSPRVVILEFNPAFGPERAVTVRYDPAFDRGQYKSVTHQFYGASLAALTRLSREKGYRLVLVEPRGANAYFLRNDVGEGVPAASPGTIHPDPAADPQPLFDLIAEADLPLVDLESVATE